MASVLDSHLAEIPDLCRRYGVARLEAKVRYIRERIRTALERRLAAYATDGRFHVPVSVKLAAGRKDG